VKKGILYKVKELILNIPIPMSQSNFYFNNDNNLVEMVVFLDQDRIEMSSALEMCHVMCQHN